MQQSPPGMTVRTIWGQAQVFQFPVKINHIGYAHVELTFKPVWANADLFVYGPDQWDGLSAKIGYHYFNMNQGYLGGYGGSMPVNKEYVDWYVPYINNTLKDPNPAAGDVSGGYVGDTYYIVVVAFDETCQTQIWGYVPTIDVGYAGTADPFDARQVLKSFRFPKNVALWKTIAGTPYGQPFAFTPTSMGNEYLTLQWPADVVAKTISDDHAKGYQPAEYESYLYAADWLTVLAQDFEGSGPGAASGWAPPTWSGSEGGIPSPWYGYFERVAVNDPSVSPNPPPGEAPAGKLQHWVASLGLAAAISANGPAVMLPTDPLDRTAASFDGAMKAGLSTFGYKATIGLPQNLTIRARSVSVKKGLSVVISGQLALDMGSGPVVQPGVSVKIEKKVGSIWVKVKTITTGVDGKFSATVVPTATTSWRATCAGNAATGLAVETSLTKKIIVHL